MKTATTPASMTVRAGLALLASACVTAVAAAAEKPPQPKRPPPTLLERIQRLIHRNPAISPAGSRSGGSKAVCLITPHLTATHLEEGVEVGEAVVPLGAPVLIVPAPLSAIRLTGNGHGKPYVRLASLGQPLPGRIPWPVAPIQPRERINVQLRLTNTSGAEHATFRIVGASAQEMERGRQILQTLGNDPSRWLAAVQQELLTGNQAMASALLFHPEIPNVNDVIGLQSAVIRSQCTNRRP
ncbi:hypothetical protein [Cyanobium gracile]|uniref:Uncharacterized protein n=1 Tax=Cyanobium gracile (strain ATCC 27147 / PCC 6307) TaxID=292564 RepID=K9P334_CYAGP|nr:hypothetical protein [Cyanobium gracile]AFY27490.1 hypothetical protein Cyagr_0291 [Cyanobium gracile PCC 6307]